MNEKPYNGTPPREVTPDGFKVYCAYDEIVETDSLPHGRPAGIRRGHKQLSESRSG